MMNPKQKEVLEQARHIDVMAQLIKIANKDTGFYTVVIDGTKLMLLGLILFALLS